MSETLVENNIGAAEAAETQNLTPAELAVFRSCGPHTSVDYAKRLAAARAQATALGWRIVGSVVCSERADQPLGSTVFQVLDAEGKVVAEDLAGNFPCGSLEWDNGFLSRAVFGDMEQECRLYLDGLLNLGLFPR
jgi:hypothetical protein